MGSEADLHTLLVGLQERLTNFSNNLSWMMGLMALLVGYCIGRIHGAYSALKEMQNVKKSLIKESLK